MGLHSQDTTFVRALLFCPVDLFVSPVRYVAHHDTAEARLDISTIPAPRCRRVKKKLLALAVLLVMLVAIWFARSNASVRIPALLAADLPTDCQQVVLVLSPEATSFKAKLWLLERRWCLGWRVVEGPIPATIGRNGLAWGVGEHRNPAPEGFRIKHEGDGCSPAGVFRIPFAFGTAPTGEGFRLPYTALTPTIIGVDDPKSRYYNQIVDNSKVARDWDSNEPMIRHDRLYERGAFIAHNPSGTPGLGSCIFIHLWPGPGISTAGCTAMSAEDLKMVLKWLDPAKEPRIVQGLDGW